MLVDMYEMMPDALLKLMSRDMGESLAEELI